ncbi:LPD7 domain-containing protein [Roseibium sp. SCPC15]|uniref:LPD7 domain-containing protein n=1 Tax=Roseibium sp. SCP15 TaxID=3141376 RepID=UPI00333BB8FA
MTEHTGDEALAYHWLKADGHERVEIRTHGLLGRGAVDGLQELCLLASGCRSRKPILHTWASPSIEYDAHQWEDYWCRFEDEMDLVGQPYVEAEHQKFGRGGRHATHVHRAYLRVSPEGKAIRMSHLAPRQEKLSRISEFMTGEPFTSGIYNRSVITTLRETEFAAVANAMVEAGLDQHRATRATSAQERAASERLEDMAIDEVEIRVWRAWNASDDGKSFRALLDAAGLRLATGEKVAVVVTPRCNRVPLRRALSRVAKRHGQASIRKADVDSRLAGLELIHCESLEPLNDFAVERLGVTGRATRENRKAAKEELEPSYQPTEIFSNASAESPRHLGEHKGTPEYSEPATPRPLDPAQLTPEVLAAIDRFKAAFFASPSPAEGSEQSDIRDLEVEQKAKLRCAKALESELYQQPSLQEVTWRDSYKAQLANLPRELGPRLAWVEQQAAARARIRLKTGVVVTTEPLRATVSKPTTDTVDVVVAHAKRQGWRQVVITGGTDEWRERLTRAVTRAGMEITNPELKEFAANETDRELTRSLVRTWLTTRKQAQDTRNRKDIELFYLAIDELKGATDLDFVLGPDLARRYKSDRERLRIIREEAANNYQPVGP